MWKKRKCFTLMELLVVVAVIALLLAVLLPSLRKAKEMAGRIVCGNHERQLLTANNLYANSWDEQFCPPMMVNGKAPDAPKPEIRKPPIGWENGLRKLNWLSNPDFRKLMALDDAQISKYDNVMPDAYFCPADKVARYDDSSEWNVLVSYAHNVTEWPDEVDEYWNEQGTPSVKQWLIGYKRTAIPRASEKINFADSSDWWCTWWGANYAKGWDEVGHGNWEDYRDVGIYGPVLYRHNEGANIAFYDGHVEHMAKDKVFVDTDEDPTNGDVMDDTDMWYVTWP